MFDFLPDSNSKPPSLKTLKYVYVNLQNFSCQDYKNLDADEYPLTNYKLKKGQFIQWNFFWENEFVDNTFKTYMELSDTTIENINYKRILF